MGRIDEEQYRQRVDDMSRFLGGQTDAFIKDMRTAMEEASTRQDYEEAGRWRDRMGALTRAMERNAVVLGDSTDADVVGLHDDPLEVGVQVFHVRAGRLIGERSFIVEKAEDLSVGGYGERVLQRLYAAREGVEIDSAVPPREILVSHAPADIDALAQWLSSRRGSTVEIRVPQRGDKRALMETATTNAAEALMRHRMRRPNDMSSRSEAIAELQLKHRCASNVSMCRRCKERTRSHHSLCSKTVFRASATTEPSLFGPRAQTILHRYAKWWNGASRGSNKQSRRPTMLRFCRAKARPGVRRAARSPLRIRRGCSSLTAAHHRSLLPSRP